MVACVALAVIAALLGAFYQYVDSMELPQEMFDDIHKHTRSLGYSLESHQVTTGDGYILSLFRPFSAPAPRGKPVLLIHGVGVSGDQFTINFHAKPLAYRLLDEGYDVWIANTRGSPYSDSHVSLTAEDSEFWDWTAEDIMRFDVPLFIDCIYNHTNRRVAVVGHSQGATVALGMLALSTVDRQKVSVFLGIACPGARNSNESWIFYIFTHPTMLDFFGLIGKDHFFRRGKSLWFQKLIARFPTLGYYYIKSRYDPEINGDEFGRFHVLSYRVAGGTSLKNLKYFSQNIRSNDPRPRLFDYGPRDNLQIYGAETPPRIDFSKIQTKMAFFGGSFDLVVKPEDLKALIATLPAEEVVFQKLDYHQDHGSFALSGNQEHVSDMLAVLAAHS